MHSFNLITLNRKREVLTPKKNVSIISVFDSVEDLKSINSNAFWNGILDENGSLLDVIDNKKQFSESTPIATTSAANLADRRPIRRRSNQSQRTGHSTFNVVNLNEDESIFVKNDTKEDVSKLTTAQKSNNAISVDCSNANEAVASVKKELDGVDATVVSNNIAMEIQIKDEPVDETSASNADEQNLQVRQQMVPVIKTETGNSMSVVSNSTIQRPLTMQQTAQLQHQSHPQTFSTNDQTLILSSRPIRRLTTNGPADGKAGKLVV